MESEEPWQTLAICMEIRDALKHENPADFVRWSHLFLDLFCDENMTFLFYVRPMSAIFDDIRKKTLDKKFFLKVRVIRFFVTQVIGFGFFSSFRRFV